MNTKINPALTIFLRSLREGRKTAEDDRAHIPAVVACHTVEFVRHEGERDVVGSIELAESFEKSATEPGVS